MIRLHKVTKPDVLVQNEIDWTATIVEKLAAGQSLTQTEKSRYRHPDIKAALVEETRGKCAYCESKLLHIHHGDVEHIYPKSLAPAKTVEWENLTLACEICNQNKSNLDPYVEAILDPYLVDPRDHLVFSGALMFSRGTPQGISTRQILDLNRAELTERRRERLERLMSICETLQRPDLSLGAKKAIYDDLRHVEAGPAAPYSAMAQALVAAMREYLPAGLR